MVTGPCFYLEELRYVLARLQDIVPVMTSPRTAISLNQASLILVQIQDEDAAMFIFSNGVAISIESERLKQFLTTSANQVA